jgi:bacterioferritin
MHEKSIEVLNKSLGEELQAIHQYMYFHFHADDQGYDPLSLLFRQTAIEEMMHAERIAERILFLKGEVEMVLAAPVEKIPDPGGMLTKAKELEVAAVRDYNLRANECAANADSASKRLFEDLVVDEERHLDQFEVQEDNIAQFGLQFLALQSIERSKTLGTPGGAGGAAPA